MRRRPGSHSPWVRRLRGKGQEQHAVKHAYRENDPVTIAVEVFAEIALDRIGIVVANDSARPTLLNLKVVAARRFIQNRSSAPK
jgi:hypothetical protein